MGDEIADDNFVRKFFVNTYLKITGKGQTRRVLMDYSGNVY